MGTNVKKKILLSALALVVVGIAVLSLANDKYVTDTYYRVGSFLGGDPEWIKLHKNYIAKYGHIFAYFVLTLLLVSGGYFRVFVSIFLAVFLGGGIELMQMLTPNRQPLLADFVYNATGVIVAAACLWGWGFIRHKISPSDLTQDKGTV